MRRSALIPVVALALAAGVAACGGESRQAPEQASLARRQAKPVTKLSDIDPRGRTLLLAYGRGGEEWEAARASAVAETEAGDPRAELFLIDNIALEMVRAYRAAAIETALEDRAVFERAQTELARFGANAVPLLAEMASNADQVLAFLGVDTLKRVGAPAVDAVLALLEHEREQVRQRAAEILGELELAPGQGRDVAAALAQRMQTDGSWVVRAQATRALGDRTARRERTAPGWEAARDLLERTLMDTDPAVSKEAAIALGRLKDERSVAPLLALWAKLDRDHATNPAVTHRDYLIRRRAIETALREITGETQKLTLDAWRRRGSAPVAPR